MDVFAVAFFGHRIIDNPFPLEQKLEQIIHHLLTEKAYVEWLVGRDGNFDQLVSSTVRRCKKAMRSDNSALMLVLPYETAEYRDNTEAFHAYYDDVVICESSARAHFKGAHQRRNREMIRHSNLVVCCMEYKTGGTWQAVQYAKALGKPIINLAEGEHTSSPI